MSTGGRIELDQPNRDTATESLPHTRLSAGIDRFVARIGEILSWVWLVLLDRVNQLEDRVRKTHMGAIGSVLLALLWLALAMLRVEAHTG